MSKIKSGLRILKFVLLAFFTSGWILPLSFSADEILLWLHKAHRPDYGVDPGFYVQLSQGLIGIASGWLFIVIFFWVFVVANRLWPSDKKL